MLGAVFEETPAVAEQTWAQRPFESVADLHEQMVRVVQQMPAGEQLALIQAHPELGATAKMAAASVAEQAGAGLGELNEGARDRLKQLNADYRDKFGFPFVMAVKGQGKQEILAAFEARLRHGQEEEQARSLTEISKIARFRLEEIFAQ